MFYIHEEKYDVTDNLYFIYGELPVRKVEYMYSLLKKSADVWQLLSLVVLVYFKLSLYKFVVDKSTILRS